MSHKLIIAALLSAFTVGTVWSVNERQGDTAAERKIASIKHEFKAEQIGSLLFAPRENQRYIYSFERKILIQGFGKNMPEIFFHGELMLDIIRVNSKGFEAVVTEKILEHPNISSPAIRIQVDARGEQLNIFTAKISKEEDKQHISIMKDLLANLIFPLDRDTVGRYQAKFENLPAEAGLLLRKKTKITYLDAPPPAPIITDSVHWLKWDLALSIPREIKGSEETKMQQDDAGFSSHAVYSIQFKSQTAIDARSLQLAKNLNEKDELLMNRAAANMSDNPEYAHLTWAELSNKLRNAEKLSSSEQMKLFGELVHLLRAGKAGVEDLLAMLSGQLIKAGPNSPAYRLVVGTLATVGGAEAYSALIQLYLDPNNTVPGKGLILGAITTTQAPVDAKTRDFLAEEMNNKNTDLAYGAAYALGAALQSSDAGEVKKGISAIQDAWSALAQNNSIEGQLAMIDAMGNSGRAEFIPLLSTILNGNNPSVVRAKAIFALRFMKENSAASLIAQNLTGNSDINMREAAVEAMKAADWNESFRPPLQSCSAQESITRIKASCESVLAQKGLQVAGN